MQKQDTDREKFEKSLNLSLFNKRRGWNTHTGWTFLPKLINVGYGIRAWWLENWQKINKRTPTIIRESRV